MLYTKQTPIPPHYSGSAFSRREEAERTEESSEREAEDTEMEATSTPDDTESNRKKDENTNPPPEISWENEKETVATSAHTREKRPSLLSRFGLDRLFGFDLEDLLILVLAFILLTEDGESDLLPLLLVLLLTGK